MKLKKQTLDYISLIKYLSVFFLFFAFGCLEKNDNVYSVAIFASSVLSNSNVIICLTEHLLSLLIMGQTGMLLSSVIADVLIIITAIIYRHYKINVKIECIGYVLLSLLPFVFLGNTLFFIDYEKRIISAIFTAILSFVLLKTANTVDKKGLKYKFTYEEYLFLAISVVLFGLGLSNFISPTVWKSISVLLILILSFIFKTGISSLCSSVLGLSLGIYYSDLTYLSIFLLLSIVSECFMSVNRFLSCTAVILCDFFIFYFLKAYSTYGLIDFISVATPSIVFAIIPTTKLTELKNKLYLFREKQLTRQTINRNRIMLSNKLFDLSGLFTEIASAFCEFNKKGMTEYSAKDIIINEISASVCSNCLRKDCCVEYASNYNETFSKLIDIGFAKGKITLIDFPKSICENCSHTNDIMFCANKLIAEYKKYLVEQTNLNVSRDLIKEETLGIADILKGLALESGTTLKYQNKTERELAKKLFENGFIVSELLIYGEGKSTSVSMILSMQNYNEQIIEKIIFEVTGYLTTACDKTEINEEKCYLAFKVTTEFDAVFGLTFGKKDGSKKSGDTHAINRINDDKFLVALSDGMGSGETAEKVSSFSLSLIETFYKAGLKDQLILTTINKLLNVNCDDVFTALDVAVIDLNNASCDFIKYGSPYGFIIGNDGIKIVEGNTLPLGILENIKPSVASTPLDDGDVVLLLTDGVSDAFGSSGELIDFLRSQPALNPQSLTDSLINKAVELNGGIKKDDMTALAVRFFKKAI